MSISVVTIDFWNTLVDSSGGDGRNRQRAETMIAEAKRLGVDLDMDQVKTAGENSWAFFRQHWLELVRTPLTHEMVDHMWKELGLPDDPEAKKRVEEVYAKGIVDHPPALLPGVKDALPALAERYTLGIVSDTAISPGIYLKEVLHNHGVLEFFTHFSFSDETGVAKPHRKAFDTILDATKTDPDTGLHIGDIERTDVAGSRGIGMFAILYSGDHRNSVVKSDVKETKANRVSHHWDDIKTALTGGHDFKA